MAQVKMHESDVEEAALHWLEDLGYSVAYGPDLLPDGLFHERDEQTVILEGRLESALLRLNPGLPFSAISDAMKRLVRPQGASLEAMNRDLHRMVVDGIDVEYQLPGEPIRGARVRVIDCDDPDNNDWLALNQFTVIEGDKHRRPDIVVFINGLPLSVFELKNAGNENST